LALGVAEPYGSGLGGKLVLLYHQSATGRTFVVEALDQTPLALDAEAVRGLDRDARRNGLRAVAVPGLLAGLDEAHRRWGSGAIAWARLVEPAIALAERGFEVQRQAHEIFRLARS